MDELFDRLIVWEKNYNMTKIATTNATVTATKGWDDFALVDAALQRFPWQ